MDGCSNTAEDNRPAAYIEDGKIILRASAISQCPVRLANVLIGLQEQHSESTLAIFRQGHAWEEVIVGRLLETGIEVHSRQDELELTTPYAIVRGHIDGMLPGVDIPYLLSCARIPITSFRQGKLPQLWEGVIFEAKSASNASFEDFCRTGLEGFPNYRKQLATYVEAAKVPGALIVFVNKETTELCAEYFSNLFADEELQSIHETCKRVIDTLQALSIGEEPKCGEWRKQKFPCPHEQLHEKEEVATVEDLTLEALIDDYCAIKAQITELTERSDDIKKLIKKHHDKFTDFRCGRHLVKWVNGRESTDWDGIARDHPEVRQWIAEYKKIGQGYLRVWSGQ